MKLTENHLKLWKEIQNRGINRRCSDTDRDLYKHWSPAEIYELNYKAYELNGNLEEALENEWNLTEHLDDYNVDLVVRTLLIDNYFSKKKCSC